MNRLGFMCVRHTGFSFSVLLLCLQFFFCELSDRNLLYKGFPIILNSQINSHMVLNFYFFFTILAFLKIQFLWQLPLPPHIPLPLHQPPHHIPLVQPVATNDDGFHIEAFHTCNNSWYTFMDGGPWNPWIPSKVNSHCPASSAEDDSGIVAIPHLSRDLMACFDGNGSNFGTHPQNVLRGMIYYNEDGEYEYPCLEN